MSMFGISQIQKRLQVQVFINSYSTVFGLLVKRVLNVD